MKRVIFLVIQIVAFCILLQTHLLAADWGKQDVSISGSVHYMTIRMDSHDRPRIVFGGMNSSVAYAYRTGTTWNFQEIVEDVLLYPTMEIGSDDIVRVTYIDYPNGDLYYRELNGSSWDSQKVEHTEIGMHYSDLALDNANNPYIAYCTKSAYIHILKLAKWNGTAWETEVIDPNIGGYQQTASLVIGTDGNPQVAYRTYSDYDEQPLKYAKWNGSSWVLSTVESGIIANCVALDVDSSNNPHILYVDNNSGNLKYASWNGATWDIEVIEAGGVSLENTLIIDNSDVPHIAFLKYYGEPGHELIYAVKTGGTWDQKVVETAEQYSDTTRYDSLALDSQGNPYLVYQYAHVGFKYAFWTDTQKPVLSWVGTTGYENDGVSPESGLTSESYIFKVKYMDPDNDSPADDYPKLHIKKGTAEITGSPFTMVSSNNTNYNQGRTYEYTATLSSGNYNYYLEAYDVWFSSATQLTGTGPIVGAAPELSWTDEHNYASAGVFPSRSDIYDNFVFRVKYTDTDNELPLSGYPKLHLLKGNQELSGSPFTLTEIDTADSVTSDGKIYSLSFQLSAGSDYDYFFEAKDPNGITARGEATATIHAPYVVEDWVPERLSYTYPNPALGGTVNFHFVCYYLNQESEINIYNLNGELLRKITDDKLDKSGLPVNRYAWDCRNEENEKISSGVYLAIIKIRNADNGEETKFIEKIAIIK